MQKIILFILVLFAIWGGCLPLVELVLSMIASYIFCNISPDTTYSWYEGIWHGLFFLPNWMWSGFGDRLYKAEYYTDAYNILWWIFSILTTSFIVWLYNIIGTILIFISSIINAFSSK